MKWSPHNFAHYTTAVLWWHMLNFAMIWQPCVGLYHNQFSINEKNHQLRGFWIANGEGNDLVIILSFSFKKIYLKMLSAKWQPYYLTLNVLPYTSPPIRWTESVWIYHRCQHTALSPGRDKWGSIYSTLLSQASHVEVPVTSCAVLKLHSLIYPLRKFLTLQKILMFFESFCYLIGVTAVCAKIRSPLAQVIYIFAD